MLIKSSSVCLDKYRQKPQRFVFSQWKVLFTISWSFKDAESTIWTTALPTHIFLSTEKHTWCLFASRTVCKWSERTRSSHAETTDQPWSSSLKQGSVVPVQQKYISTATGITHFWRLADDFRPSSGRTKSDCSQSAKKKKPSKTVHQRSLSGGSTHTKNNLIEHSLFSAV